MDISGFDSDEFYRIAGAALYSTASNKRRSKLCTALIGECSKGLMHECLVHIGRHARPKMDIALTTIVYNHARWARGRLCKNAIERRVPIDETISLEESKAAYEVDFERLAAILEVKEQIELSMRRLTIREREIIKMRFGFHEICFTLEECGRVFKVSRERIRSIEAKAIRKLQRYSETISVLKTLQNDLC